jgi:mannose-6-phosphate isomerase
MDYATLDSFVIYMCLEGGLDIRYDDENRIQLVKGDTILIPAAIRELTLDPKEESRLLEIYL